MSRDRAHYNNSCKKNIRSWEKVFPLKTVTYFIQTILFILIKKALSAI